MPHPLARYRCTLCWRTDQTVCDIGPLRVLWCGRCAQSRLFARVEKDRLAAPAWPPPERQAPAS